MKMVHRSRPAVLAALLCLVCALPACSAGASSGRAPIPPDAALPQPEGVSDPGTTPSAVATSAGCDPLASFRPPGALPEPGRMPSGSTMAEIAQRGRLVVGVSQNAYRLAYRDPDTGELSGFEIDIARQIAEALLGDPDKILFRTISAADRIPMIQNGDVDLVIRTMTMNCERWQQVSFSSQYYPATQRLLTYRSSGVRTLADLAGKKVCAATGSSTTTALLAASPAPALVTAPEVLDCLVLLQQGQVSAVSTDDIILAGLAAQDPQLAVVGPGLAPQPMGVAAARDATDLIRFVNGVLARMRSDGTWRKLYDRWLAELGAAPDLPAARYRD